MVILLAFPDDIAVPAALSCDSSSDVSDADGGLCWLSPVSSRREFFETPRRDTCSFQLPLEYYQISTHFTNCFLFVSIIVGHLKYMRLEPTLNRMKRVQTKVIQKNYVDIGCHR